MGEPTMAELISVRIESFIGEGELKKRWLTFMEYVSGLERDAAVHQASKSALEKLAKQFEDRWAKGSFPERWARERAAKITRAFITKEATDGS